MVEEGPRIDLLGDGVGGVVLHLGEGSCAGVGLGERDANFAAAILADVRREDAGSRQRIVARNRIGILNLHKLLKETLGAVAHRRQHLGGKTSATLIRR